MSSRSEEVQPESAGQVSTEALMGFVEELTDDRGGGERAGGDAPVSVLSHLGAVLEPAGGRANIARR